MSEANVKAIPPVIAVVGRPNVGKSSLFNAIVGRKLAIVHEMSGVTRDRVVADIRWQGRAFTLIDTGGLNTLDGMEKNVDMWDAGISEQAECAMMDADALILVCDSQSGLTPLDLEVANRVRKLNKPVIVAANKCDSDEWKDHAAEFSRLGFGAVYPICCTHRGGIGALVDAALRQCRDVPVTAVTRKTALNVAVVGRPNVGKSSLINALLGRERVMTSPVAGTTRDAVKIEFSIHGADGAEMPVQLVDTAGLRKTGKVDSAVEVFSVMRAKSAVERADVVVMVLEAGIGRITAQDRKIAALIEQSGRGCVIAANKCDLCEREKVEALSAELRRALPGLSFAPAAFVSAKTKHNLRCLEQRIFEVAANLKTEITTGVLNRVLAAAMEQTPPPVIKGVPLKLFYASLAGVRPPRVKLFVNRVEAAADNYLTFLKKRIRENFALSGIPLALEVCARPKKVESIRRAPVRGAKQYGK